MLYLVATPIGNLLDITLRALEVLKDVDIIACEDKRVSSKLLNHYNISKPLFSYHDHNADQVRGALLKHIEEGKKVAYITDGGMPLISDPGFKLVRDCQDKGLPYTIIPGPSAPLAALAISGLSPQTFMFCGFLPSKQSGRIKGFEDLKHLKATLIFFESPKRLGAFLKDANDILGNRTGAVCREITKVYENVQKNLLSALQAHYESHPPKGEIVVIIEGAPETAPLSEKELETELKKALSIYTLKEAVEVVSKVSGYPKREVYQYALSLKSKEKGLS